jgi:hypothetical protein
MTIARQRLPNRHASQQIAFVCNDLKYVATISFFDDGRLQYGIPVETIRKALLRDPRSVASSPLGVALDIVVGLP